MPEMVESTVEEATLDWLSEFHYSPLYGLDIAPGEQASERESFADVVLVARVLGMRWRESTRSFHQSRLTKWLARYCVPKRPASSRTTTAFITCS